jgi:hypothetical protein
LFYGSIDSKYDNELVVEEYYKHDFGDEMARIQNAADLMQKPTSVANGIEIVFKVFDPKKIKGKCPFTDRLTKN